MKDFWIILKHREHCCQEHFEEYITEEEYIPKFKYTEQKEFTN